jgi:hypothetical protein
VYHDDLAAKTHFSGNGHKYHWNGQTLVDETGAVVAQLSAVVDDPQEITGKLVIKGQHSQALRDPIVISALLVQSRSDENRTWF